MLKKCMTLALVILMMIVSFEGFTATKTKASKKKARSSYAYSKGKNSKNKSTNKKSKKGKRYKRSGNGPDLKALTTEKAESQYSEDPDNGVNSVEVKTGL